MIVKDIIVSSLNLLGRRDLAETLENGVVTDAEGRETVNTLLYCFNAVEDELARKYLPLNAREEVASPNGQFEYVRFKHQPVRINRVTVDGADAEYELFPKYMQVNSKRIVVEYDYAPFKKELENESEYGYQAGENLLALGAVAEYCLINGEIEASELWEKKYRQAIDLAQKKLPAGGYIMPRRWI